MRFVKWILVAALLLPLGNKNILFAYTPIKGIQAGTWTLSESPYIVNGDLFVPKGLVLKIEPGVIIKFSDNYKLTIEGALIANGSEKMPIVFTSIYDNEFARIELNKFRIPHPGEWEGIEILDNSDDFTTIINYSIIRYSRWNITCENAYPVLTNLKIVDIFKSSLKINGKNYYFNPNDFLNPLTFETRPVINPLPEPPPEVEIEKQKRLEYAKRIAFRKKARADSIRRAQKIKPTDTETGKLSLDRDFLKPLSALSCNHVLGFLPGFSNISTIWRGPQLMTRSIPPTLSNNRILFTIEGIPFYESISRVSYLELVPIDAIERVEIQRGLSFSNFSTQSVGGVVNFIPRQEEKSHISESRAEFGMFGTKNLNVFLGVNKDSTQLNLSTQFRNNAGYWRDIQKDASGNSYRQKYMNELYNFFLSAERPTLSIYAAYFNQDAMQPGLMPQNQFNGPTYNRCAFLSMKKKIKISDYLNAQVIANYTNNFERNSIGNAYSNNVDEENTAISKGQVFHSTVQFEYKKHQYFLTSGVNLSKVIANPIFRIEQYESENSSYDLSSNSKTFSNLDKSLYFNVSYNISSFWGFEGKTNLFIPDRKFNSYLSYDGKFIYNPFFPIDTYIRFSQFVRPPTLFEKYINLPGLFVGNKKLSPEKYDQFEWALDVQPHKNWQIGLAAFYLKYSRMINIDKNGVFKNMNNFSSFPGYEFSLNGKISRKLAILANASYYDNQFDDIIYPKLLVNSVFTVHWSDKISNLFMFQYIDQSKSFVSMGPYYLIHTIFSMQLLPKISLSCTMYDILNQQPKNPEYIRGELPAIPSGFGRSFFLAISVN